MGEIELNPDAWLSVSYDGNEVRLVPLDDSELALMTNVLVEAHKDMREDRGLKADPNRWVNESKLLRLVRKRWPSARREYSPTWLGSQRLDIAVPKIKLAIEYQGKQHYEPIDFFGGSEAFAKRRILDARKKELCQENNFVLMEWKYDEPITDAVLDEKLSSLGIAQ